MIVVHLTASTFFGGPERQMLGLGESLRPALECRYLSFPEDGKCLAFVEEARRRQLVAQALEQDFPRVGAAIAELESLLRSWRASVESPTPIISQPASRAVQATGTAPWP